MLPFHQYLAHQTGKNDARQHVNTCRAKGLYGHVTEASCPLRVLAECDMLHGRFMPKSQIEKLPRPGSTGKEDS